MEHKYAPPAYKIMDFPMEIVLYAHKGKHLMAKLNVRLVIQDVLHAQPLMESNHVGLVQTNMHFINSITLTIIIIFSVSHAQLDRLQLEDNLNAHLVIRGVVHV